MLMLFYIAKEDNENFILQIYSFKKRNNFC